MMESNKYSFEDYMQLLQERFGNKCQIDHATNKLGQDTVRLRYQVNKIRSFELFIFESGFAVSYKPNNTTKCYERLTPKQAAHVVEMILDWYSK